MLTGYCMCIDHTGKVECASRNVPHREREEYNRYGEDKKIGWNTSRN